MCSWRRSTFKDQHKKNEIGRYKGKKIGQRGGPGTNYGPGNDEAWSDHQRGVQKSH